MLAGQQNFATLPTLTLLTTFATNALAECFLYIQAMHATLAPAFTLLMEVVVWHQQQTAQLAQPPASTPLQLAQQVEHSIATRPASTLPITLITPAAEALSQ